MKSVLRIVALSLALSGSLEAQDPPPPEKYYATGLVSVSAEDANQVVLIVPEWDVVVSMMAFKRDLASELGEDDYHTILVEKGEKAEQLRALEGKVVAVEGVVGQADEGDEEPPMKVTDFAEAQHDAAKALLGIKK